MTASSAGRPRLTNLQLRIVSAVVLAAAVLAATWHGGVASRILWALMAGAIFYEWTTIAAKTGRLGPRILAAVFLAASMLAMVAGFSAETVFLVLAVGTALVFAFGVANGGGRETALGLAYAGASGAALSFLRGADDNGLVAILFLFAVVWATDILAYFVGRALGGPKLAPRISPGKTWSGAIGGALGGVVGGVLLALAAGSGHLLLLACVALFLSAVSQVGDLFESAVKRRHGAKDSGGLIPGHGGVMDRVDGLVAAGVALYLIGAVAGSFDEPARLLFQR